MNALKQHTISSQTLLRASRLWFAILLLESLAIGWLVSPLQAELPDSAWVSCALPIRSAAILLLVFSLYLVRTRNELKNLRAWSQMPQGSLVAINVVGFTALAIVLLGMREDLKSDLLTQGKHWLYLGYGFAMVSFIVSGFTSLISYRLGSFTVSQYGKQIILVGGFALLLYNFSWISDMIGAYWFNWFGLLTVKGALSVCQLFGLDPTISWVWYEKIVDFPVVHTDTFVVAITQACSGFQSIALYLCIMSVYLFINAKQIGIHRVLWIAPVSILFLMLLNTIRIAVLIMIGAFYSAEIASNGFHSSSGWLYLIMVVMISITYIERQIRIGGVGPSPQKCTAFEGEDQTYLIVPLMIYIATSLIVKTLSGEFNWLYPIPVVVTATYLWFHRRDYPIKLGEFGLLSMLVGMLVTLMWVEVIPIDFAHNEKVDDLVARSNNALWLAWLAFRILGAVLVVPFIEEIAFRGFALDQIRVYASQRWGFDDRAAPWVALGLSSVLFGLVHNNVLAGTLEGAAYGLVRMRTGRLSDAIAAHATANAILAIYVLSTSRWNYW